MTKRIIVLTGGKIYHKDGCPYVKRCPSNNKEFVDVDTREYKKYRACKYCGGNRGYARLFHKRPYRKMEEKNMECWYQYESGKEFLYIRTEFGCWKLYWKVAEQKFLLYHRNIFDPSLSHEELMTGGYHKQRDMQSSPSFDSIVHYIYRHDQDKAIAAIDYRKLPQSTKKQRRYFRHHKKVAEKERHKRIDELFKQIESEARK